MKQETETQPKRIKSVLCPNCRKKYMQKTGRFGNHLTWFCEDCVYIWHDSWFDRFHQHEDCVGRES